MIARALMLRPKLLIADEATSMLDASLRVNVLNVLKDLREQLGMTVLFITHDIGQACYIADRVLVMEHGVMVEQGTTDQVIFNPQHEYTQRLLADVPKLHEEVELHDFARILRPSRTLRQMLRSELHTGWTLRAIGGDASDGYQGPIRPRCRAACTPT